MAHLLITENNCAISHRNQSKNVEVMILTNPDGWADALTSAHIPKCHCDDNVLLTSSQLDKELHYFTINCLIFSNAFHLDMFVCFMFGIRYRVNTFRNTKF